MKTGLRFLSLMLLLGLTTAPTANAAYDRVVTWSDMRDLDLESVLKSPYASPSNLMDPAVGASAMEIALRDADGRISPEFHIPSTLRKPVEFWLKVYTQFSTQQVLLFDAKHPEVVYEVLDFRQLAHTARNAVVYEILREKKIKTTLHAYAKAFDRLGTKGRQRGKALPEEKKILAAWKHVEHRHGFREMRENLKTQTGQRDNVMKGLLAAEAFFPRMESIFQAMGVPPELTRLSLVESSFDLRAYSRVGAVGVWQFMPGPGKKLLLIDERAGIDERLSPLKSTVAAARLLKENFVQFRSWALAVTSYNHGLRGLMKYRRSRGARNFREVAHLFEPCSKRSPFGWAGRNYYAEFLAMLYAESYRQMFYGDVPVMKVRPVAYRKIEKPKAALAFALQHGISVQLFRQANPDIRNLNGHLPRGYWIAIPGDDEDLAGLTHGRKKSKAVSVAKAPRKARKA